MATTEFQKLRNKLQKMGIKTDRPGFLDDPNFLAAEKANPAFLFDYGRYVSWQPYDSSYLAHAEQVIRIAADGVRESLLAEREQERFGKCVHACMALSQILDLHGIWNFIVSGAVCLTFLPKSGFKPFRFNIVGSNDQPGLEYGHKWIYAPPFKVVDITIKLQEYNEGFVPLLPEKVMAVELAKARTEPQDLVCKQIIEAGRDRGIKAWQLVDMLLPPHYRQFMNDFAPGMVKVNDVAMKYIPTATGGSDGSLQELASYSKGGERPYEYYVRKIKPLLDNPV